MLSGRAGVVAQSVVRSQLVQTMERDTERLQVSKVWEMEGVWAGEGAATPRSDSGLNSMEYWDYSVELECITGQQGDSSSSDIDILIISSQPVTTTTASLVTRLL